MLKKLTLTALACASLSIATATAQTVEETARAEQFFADHDANGDGLLSKPEFVNGFIAQAKAERPNQTRVALALYGKKRIENCLGLAFDRADANSDGLMSLDELGVAYRNDAFDDLREIC